MINEVQRKFNILWLIIIKTSQTSWISFLELKNGHVDSASIVTAIDISTRR